MRKSKSVYRDEISDEPKQNSRDLEEVLRKTRTYWTTMVTTPRMDSTMTETDYQFRSMNRKLGGFEFTQDWVARALTACKSEGRNVGSCNTTMAALKRVFVANGADKEIKFPIDSKWRREEHHYYTVDEVLRLISAARRISHRAILSTLYYQGLRNSELRNLPMSCVDIEKEEMRIWGQKTRKWRTIPINPDLLPVLNQWLSVRDSAVKAVRSRRISEPIELFFTTRGGKFGHDGVQRIVKRSAERAGFSGISLIEAHPHTLRHTCANHLLHVYGWDLPTVAYFLGDTVSTVAEVYAHTGIEQCRANMSKMR